jgi:hypothetical protein
LNPPIPIYLAVEDDLSEVLLRRVLQERPVFAVGPVFKRNGFGYLRKNTPAFNNMARVSPVLLLTDLDRHHCAPSLIREWLPCPRHPDFLLRVAVREVEAWALAADEPFAKFLGLRRAISYPTPEDLSDPKLELLKLASSSARRDIRDGLVRRDAGGNFRQGPAYNSTLASFIEKDWAPSDAATKCPSLGRVPTALSKLEADWQKRLR